MFSLRIRKGKNTTEAVCEGQHSNSSRLLSHAIWLHSTAPAPQRALCNGLGHCGACRVQLSGGPLPEPLPIERELLGDLLAEGFRLACRRTVAEVEGLIVTWVVEDVDEQQGVHAEHPYRVPENSPAFSTVPRPASENLRPASAVLAVDVGTTSIHWQALCVDEKKKAAGDNGTYGQLYASGQAPNPQAGVGADVVSRLAAAAEPEARHRLSRVVQDFLQQLCADLAKDHPQYRVDELCVAANTAMTTIFLDLPVDALLSAPYQVPYAGGAWCRVPALPPLWIPPQPAPFVGGDIAAGMAWVREVCTDSFPLLLMDMGTNGEFVLAKDRNTVWMTSVPLGPALEGIGLDCGGVAGPGAATSFVLGPEGLRAQVMGGGVPRVLSGTGVLSLIDLLRRNGLLHSDGSAVGMESASLPAGPPLMPLAKRLASSILRAPDAIWRIPLPGSLWLSGRDVEAVLSVRAACVLAVQILLLAAGMQSQDLCTVLLAGSMGEHAPIEALGRLGFVPQSLIPRTRAVGNTSLAGAALLGCRPDLRAELRAWCAHWHVLDVTAAPDFMARFAAAMRFDEMIETC